MNGGENSPAALKTRAATNESVDAVDASGRMSDLEGGGH